MTNVSMARAFEAAVIKAGRVVEAHYYPGGLHSGLFVDPAQHRDEMERVIAFLRKHLRD
jgi:dipeptidyl aminopeptidase/acylaminoacyl peptidase